MKPSTRQFELYYCHFSFISRILGWLAKWLDGWLTVTLLTWKIYFCWRWCFFFLIFCLEHWLVIINYINMAWVSFVNLPSITGGNFREGVTFFLWRNVFWYICLVGNHSQQFSNIDFFLCSTGEQFFIIITMIITFGVCMCVLLVVVVVADDWPK